MKYKLGEYCVGNLRFINKYDALVFASNTNQPVTWDFNDAVFSSFDWRIPVTETLEELYKQRAQQLRDSYDYVSLFFSGGVDSTNILHAFIDNGIPLDEIVMFRPRFYKHEANISTPGYNLYSELELAAIPYLNKYLTEKSVKVRTIYLEDVIETLLNNSKYTSQYYKLNVPTPTYLARVAMCATDLDWAKLYDAGKRVAHVHGMDKPVLQKIDNQYSFIFVDIVNLFVFESAENDWLAEKLKKYQHHEFFYWTPDLPKLVIKQAQIAKQVYMADPDKPIHNDRILNYIYLPKVLEARSLYYAGKALVGTNGLSHRWIHSPKIVNAKGVFIDMLTNARSVIANRFTLPDPNIPYLARPKVGLFKDFISKPYLL